MVVSLLLVWLLVSVLVAYGLSVWFRSLR